MITKVFLKNFVYLDGDRHYSLDASHKDVEIEYSTVSHKPGINVFLDDNRMFIPMSNIVCIHETS